MATVVSCGGHTDRTGDADTGTDAALDEQVDEGAPDLPEEEGPPPDAPDEDCTFPVRDQCSSSDDCGGRPCVRFPDEPGGVRRCEPEPQEEATGPVGVADECSTSDDCPVGPNPGCFTAYFGICSDHPPGGHNICVRNECETDDDCPNFCVPSRLSPWRRSQCTSGSCRVDGDCTAHPCGFCAPLADPCCEFWIQGYFCIYPGSCPFDLECTGPESCMGDPITGGTVCEVATCMD